MRRLAPYALSFVLGVGASVLLTADTRAQHSTAKERPGKIEYAVLQLPKEENENSFRETLKGVLAAQGNQGWEYVEMLPYRQLVMKRPG
jgi:hypothetical protein